MHVAIKQFDTLTFKRAFGCHLLKFLNRIAVAKISDVATIFRMYGLGHTLFYQGAEQALEQAQSVARAENLLTGPLGVRHQA